MSDGKVRILGADGKRLLGSDGKLAISADCCCVDECEFCPGLIPDTLVVLLTDIELCPDCIPWVSNNSSKWITPPVIGPNGEFNLIRNTALYDGTTWYQDLCTWGHRAVGFLGEMDQWYSTRDCEDPVGFHWYTFDYNIGLFRTATQLELRSWYTFNDTTGIFFPVFRASITTSSCVALDEDNELVDCAAEQGGYLGHGLVHA